MWRNIFRVKAKKSASQPGYGSSRLFLSRQKNGCSRSTDTITKPWWEKILIAILFIGLTLLPFAGMYSVVLIVAAILIHFMMPSAEQRFIRLQQNLATSKARSLALGIIELRGKVSSQLYCHAPVSGLNCIGYYHSVQQEELDSDGRTRYRLIHEEKFCHPFFVEDDTGKVLVDAVELDFFLLPVNETKRNGKIIEHEHCLYANREYLLIGKAIRKDNKVIITRDKLRNVFGIAPSGALISRNKLEIVKRRARYYAVAIALVIVTILFAKVDVNHTRTIIYLPLHTHLSDTRSSD